MWRLRQAKAAQRAQEEQKAQEPEELKNLKSAIQNMPTVTQENIDQQLEAWYDFMKEGHMEATEAAAELNEILRKHGDQDKNGPMVLLVNTGNGNFELLTCILTAPTRDDIPNAPRNSALLGPGKFIGVLGDRTEHQDTWLVTIVDPKNVFGKRTEKLAQWDDITPPNDEDNGVGLKPHDDATEAEFYPCLPIFGKEVCDILYEGLYPASETDSSSVATKWGSRTIAHQLKSWVDAIGPDSVRDQAKLSLLGLSTQVNQAKDAATIMFNQTSCNAETMTEPLQAYITPIVESLLHPKPYQEEERSQNGTIANGAPNRSDPSATGGPHSEPLTNGDPSNGNGTIANGAGTIANGAQIGAGTIANGAQIGAGTIANGSQNSQPLTNEGPSTGTGTIANGAATGHGTIANGSPNSPGTSGPGRHTPPNRVHFEVVNDDRPSSTLADQNNLRSRIFYFEPHGTPPRVDVTAPPTSQTGSRAVAPGFVNQEFMNLLAVEPKCRYSWFEANVMPALRRTKGGPAFQGFDYPEKFVEDLCNMRFTHSSTESWWTGLVGHQIRRSKEQIQTHNELHRSYNADRLQLNPNSIGKLSLTAPVPIKHMSELLNFLLRVQYFSRYFLRNCEIGRIAAEIYDHLIDEGQSVALEKDPNWMSFKPGEIVYHLLQVQQGEFRHVLTENDFLFQGQYNFYKHPNSDRLIQNCVAVFPTVHPGRLPAELGSTFPDGPPLAPPAPQPGIWSPVSPTPGLPAQPQWQQPWMGTGYPQPPPQPPRPPAQPPQQRRPQQQRRDQAPTERRNPALHANLAEFWRTVPPNRQSESIQHWLTQAGSSTTQCLATFGFSNDECGMFQLRGNCRRSACAKQHTPRPVGDTQVNTTTPHDPIPGTLRQNHTPSPQNLAPPQATAEHLSQITQQTFSSTITKKRLHNSLHLTTHAITQQHKRLRILPPNPIHPPTSTAEPNNPHHGQRPFTNHSSHLPTATARPSPPPQAAARRLRREHHLHNQAAALATQHLQNSSSSPDQPAPTAPTPGPAACRLHQVPPPQHPGRTGPTRQLRTTLTDTIAPATIQDVFSILTQTQSKSNPHVPLRGLMFPGPLAQAHPAGPQLKEYGTTGCPVDITANWTLDELDAAMQYGAHPSAEAAEAAQACRTEALEKVDQGFVKLMPWKTLRANIAKGLLTHTKISPIAVIPHKSRLFRMMLDLSNKGQRRRKQGPQSVNELTNEDAAPRHSMDQLGKTLGRIIYAVGTRPADQGPILFCKLDIKDGFWRMCVPEAQEEQFCYVLPQVPGDPPEEIRLVVPAALQMGWTSSPAFFCAATETGRDIAEWLRKLPRLPPHPLESHMVDPINPDLLNPSPDTDNPQSDCPTPTGPQPAQPQPPPAPANPQEAMDPLPTVNDEDLHRFFHQFEVYVDDYVGLLQSTDVNALRHHSRALLHAIHQIFPPPVATGHAGEEPISEKKLILEGEGIWDTVKEILAHECPAL
ncbi:expressed unknown protein [Seminavis robusta]|uniref:Uncharacterized protein n=1 Tax=Seminavis robusta TaxID=568900 RepID=A0A9N8HY67_9STRA|nr:expressed unknown protein [Seminavis robusta]|eukprot:Sro2723_g335600.1 n/a (1474) ;mRNA; f:3087-7760